MNTYKEVEKIVSDINKNCIRNNTISDSNISELSKLKESLLTPGDFLYQKFKDKFCSDKKEDDINKLNKSVFIDRYKKAYKENDINKCVIEIINIKNSFGNKFKENFLITGCLKSPLSGKYDENEYEKNKNIFVSAYNYAKNKNLDNSFLNELAEFFLFTETLFIHNKINIKKLENNKFSKYTLSEQLRKICIFLQNQKRLIDKNAIINYENMNFITGIEDCISRNTSYESNSKTSIIDSYTSLLEYFDELIRYIYYLKKDDFKKNDFNTHENIHPFKDIDFEELTHIAEQRVFYKMLDTKFKYSFWNIHTGIVENKNVVCFEANDKDKIKAHIASISRRRHLYTNNIKISQFISYSDETIEKAFDKLIKDVNGRTLEEWSIDSKYYQDAKKIVKPMIDAFYLSTKPFYLNLEFNKINSKDIISAYEYLYTKSTIYINSIYNDFKENDYSYYQYLSPIINLDLIIGEFAHLYDLDLNYSKNILNLFVFDKNIRYDDGDLFTRPLIKINNTSIIFCETLITQINLERNLEILFKKYKVDLRKMGIEFQNKMINKLKDSNYIEVNTNKIEFTAYDGIDVEFDFIATIDDYLLLIEFKSMTNPYEDKELYNSEQIIKDGVAQVLRRYKVLEHDWNKIKEMASIKLPDKPYKKDNIIKVVCTDIYNFTGLNFQGVRITDEFTLLKYFTDPYINIIQYDENSQKPLDLKRLKCFWKNNKPVADEFINYLDNPNNLSKILEYLEEETKQVPLFEDQSNLENYRPIFFKDFILTKDPYIAMTNKKIGRNELCYCGSGKKFKKCCGRLI
ncbi:TPA: YecA family protein [Clostridioides difficile]